MIEDGLFLALGFSVAVVLALACLPLLWSRAVRLTRQSFELLVPWSKEEIDAERDGLRAQAAVERRRLEQDAERDRAALAARNVELGHRTVDLVHVEMARDALRKERAELIGEIGTQQRDLHEADGQRFAAEKALHDADRRIETDAAAARELERRHDRLFALSEERRGAIAALETRVAGLLANLEDRDDAVGRLNAALAASASAQATLAAEHGRLGDTLASLRVEFATVRQALSTAELRIDQQDVSMKHKDERLQALQAQFDALTAELEARRDEAATHDERLRKAIVAAGDEALLSLSTGSEERDGALPDTETGKNGS